MLKWVGTVLTVLLLAVWVFPVGERFAITQRYSIRVTAGNVSVVLWASPQSSAPPDYFTFPLWLPLLVAVISTAFLWYRDRRPRPGHCQKCGYDLTGNISGRCPECGERIHQEELQP